MLAGTRQRFDQFLAQRGGDAASDGGSRLACSNNFSIGGRTSARKQGAQFSISERGAGSRGGVNEFSGSPSRRSRCGFKVCAAMGAQRRIAGRGIAGDPGTESPPSDASYDDDEPPFDGDRAMRICSTGSRSTPIRCRSRRVRIDDRPTLDRIALRLCAVAGVAALVAWASISLPTLTISLPFKPHIDQMVHAMLIPTLAPAAPAAASTTAPAPAPESRLPATPVKVEHIHTAMAPLPVAAETPMSPAIVPAAITKSSAESACARTT